VIGFRHTFPFDPTYGYTLEELLRITPPPIPADFEAFWGRRYEAALTVKPQPAIGRGSPVDAKWTVHEVQFTSTEAYKISGWLLLPSDGVIERGLVVGHGYGGRSGPDMDLPLDRTALLFPCFRGMSRSAHPPISQNPIWHVLHDIQDRDRYVLGGCVEDLWLSVSTLLQLYPELTGRVGYMGTSFGGGIGALAIPWDERINRGHLCLPTFGHHPLRLPLASFGSLASVQNYNRQHGNVLDTLQYYDAATAARFLNQHIHIAAALFDPMVPPPGQFAIYNAISGKKTLFVFDGGHFEYEGLSSQTLLLKTQLLDFFAIL